MNTERIRVEDVRVTEIPAHIEPSRVVDFNYLDPAGFDGGDIYTTLAKLHEGPDLQWTPHHGGHWIATRADDIKWIQETWKLFSSTEKGVPRGWFPFMPPITYDPPDHTRYRAVFNPHFAKRRIVEEYEPKARKVFGELIDALRPGGKCDFVSAFSLVAPIMIFFDFVNLPYDRRDEFLGWGRMMTGTIERRMEAHRAITSYLAELLDERFETPGEDIFTSISQWRDNPRFKSREELTGMAELVFLGGQDTVASMMGFSMWRLAERPDLQQRLKDDPDVIPAAVEELLRRHGLSITARLIKEDIDHKGASLKAGEMMLVVNPLSGIDPRTCEDPFTLDFDRGPIPYNSMGNGPHKCVGQHLARLEMRVFLEEWSRRMPIVSHDSDAPPPSSHTGGVIGVNHLHLRWPV